MLHNEDWLTLLATICQLIKSCSLLWCNYTRLSHFKMCELANWRSFVLWIPSPPFLVEDDWLFDCLCWFASRSQTLWSWHRLSQPGSPSHPPRQRGGGPGAATVGHLQGAAPSHPAHPEAGRPAGYRFTDLNTDRRPVKHSPWLLNNVSAESPNPCDVETFAAALDSMNRSKSPTHVSCLSIGRRSLKLRCIFSEFSTLDYDLHHL